MKKIILLLLVSALLLTFTACSDGGAPIINAATESQSTSESEGVLSTVSVEYDDDDLDSSTNGADMSYILLEGDSITLNGDGAVVDGNQIAITSAGTYVISGTLDDGQIIVNTNDQETVKLVFKGVDITYSKSSPIYIKNAKKPSLR